MATFPGGSNTFVPSWDASGKLQVEFSRNPKSFAINDYVGLRTAKKETGYYMKVTPEEAARVVDLADYVWPDGAAGSRPGGQTNDNLEQFEWTDFRCTRYKYDYPIGYLAAEQADFDVLAMHGRIMAQKAMTLRSITALSTLTNSANWGNNTATATALGGGLWDSSSATNQYILKTILEVNTRINKATLGVVRPGHLRLIINPILAARIRANAEIIDFIKQQGNAGEMLKGTSFFQKWGLPEYLYGIKLVIDDTVRISTRRNKSVESTKDYALATNQAVVVALTQDVDGETVRKPEPGDGVATFDTITLFMKEDMTVESRDNPNDRRHEARIIDHFGCEMTAPATGFLITSVAA